MSPLTGRVATPRSAILLAALLATACGADNGGDDRGPSDGSAELPDGQAPGPDSGQPGPDSGQPGPRDAGADPDAALPALAVCEPVCTGPADCDFSQPHFDSDNHDCQNNFCVYTGCNNDAECQAFSANFVCRAYPGKVVPTCERRCATPDDCDLGFAAYDSDNYDCQNDFCVYTGCHSDAECQAVNGNDVCRVLGSVVPRCVRACATPDDCDMGIAPYDSDNYDCQNDICVYTGCTNDAECQALGNYACSSGG